MANAAATLPSTPILKPAPAADSVIKFRDKVKRFEDWNRARVAKHPNLRGALSEAMVPAAIAAGVLNPIAGGALLGTSLYYGARSSRTIANFLSFIGRESDISNKDSVLNKIFERGKSAIPKPISQALDGIEKLETGIGSAAKAIGNAIPYIPGIAQLLDAAYVSRYNFDKSIKDRLKARQDYEKSVAAFEAQSKKDTELFLSRDQLLNVEDPTEILGYDSEYLINQEDGVQALQGVNIPFLLNIQLKNKIADESNLFVDAYKNAFNANKDLNNILSQIKPENLKSNLPAIIANLINPAVSQNAFDLAGINFKAPENREHRYLLARYLQYILNAANAGASVESAKDEINAQMKKLDEFVRPTPKDETPAQQNPAVQGQPGALDPTSDLAKRYSFTTLKKRAELSDTKELTTDQQKVLKKYIELAAVGNAYSTMPFYQRLGHPEAVPEDVAAKFEEGGFKEGSNPFLQLRYLTPPTLDQLAEDEKQVDSIEVPTETSLSLSIAEVKKDIGEVLQKRFNDYLSSLKSSKLNKVVKLAQIAKGAADTTGGAFLIDAKPVPTPMKEKLDKIFKREPITWEDVEESEKEKRKTSLLNDIYALTTWVADPNNIPDEQERKDAIEIATSLSDLVTDFVEEDKAVFGSEGNARSSVLGYINAVNLGNPNTFTSLMHTYEGNARRLDFFKDINSKQASTEEKAKELTGEVQRCKDYKKGIIDRLKDAYGDPQKLKALREAHNLHVQRIANGEVIDIEIIDSSTQRGRSERDPQGLIALLDQDFQAAKDKKIDEAFKFDPSVLHEMFQKNDLWDRKLFPPKNLTSKGKTQPYTEKELDSDVEIQNLRTNLGNLVLVYSKRRSDLEESIRTSGANIAEDLQNEYAFVTAQLAHLQGVGFSVEYSAKVNFNKRVFLMYLNGMNTDRLAALPQTLEDSATDESNLNFRKGKLKK